MKKILLIILIPLTHCFNAQCWRSISTGDSFCIAIKDDGTLWTWGYNSLGQLGDGTFQDKNTPTQIGNESNWQSIDAGNTFCLAIKTDSTLWAWGSNNYGQLGDGTNINSSSPIQIGSNKEWKSISGGWCYSLGIKIDGTLWAWGLNDAGQLGIGSTVNANAPLQVGMLSSWKIISAGGGHSLGLKNDSTLWAWGYNGNSQLGDGTNVTSHVPINILNPTPNTKWKSISAGYSHSLGIRSDKTLFGWGTNLSGELCGWSGGSSFFELDNNMVWESISAGKYYCLGIKKDSTLWAWGSDNCGQLGLGSGAGNISQITQVGIDKDWKSTSTGVGLSVGTKYNGTSWGWGCNFFGDVGDGTNFQHLAPATTICAPTSIREIFNNFNASIIFPNPNRGSFKIENTLDDSELILLNSLGEKIHSQYISKGENEITIKDLPEGIYFYSILENGKSISNGKVVLQK